MRSRPASKGSVAAATAAALKTFGSAPQPPLGSPPSPEMGAQHGRQRLAGAFSIRLDRIRPDPAQPRRDLDADAQRDLVASIRRLGVLQPISVRYIESEDVYQVISGERRFQASREAGLSEIPCWVQSPKDEEVLLRQIVENWQRSELHPYELADSLVRLRDANGYTQRDLARETGKPESEISKLLALQRLDPAVQKAAREDTGETYSKRHLYALSRLKPEEQKEVADEVRERQLTAIETEKAIRRRLPDATGRKRGGAPATHLRYATEQATVTLNFRKRNVTSAEIIAALDEVRLKVEKPSDPRESPLAPSAQSS
jgi:ParB family transcriptional regulator, chromosome partitioning protein